MKTMQTIRTVLPYLLLAVGWASVFAVTDFSTDTWLTELIASKVLAAACFLTYARLTKRPTPPKQKKLWKTR